jgi:glycosyltransferase involved in cell wall biosynthesis
MRILITTQVVDSEDPQLGFFHRWIEEFAAQCENVEVICLYEGKHELPKNVRVHSLGKEKQEASRLQYALRFYDQLFRLRGRYDAVFVHMNPEYVLLGGVWWWLARKRVALWYLHKSVDLKLRVAVAMVSVVLTASKESFRLKSSKVHIVGHGIAVEKFTYDTRSAISGTDLQKPLKIVTIGRVSRSKGLHTILAAVSVLGRTRLVSLTIIGGTVSDEDNAYRAELEDLISKAPLSVRVHFAGPKTPDEVAELLPTFDLFLHASTGTGSLDKAVLEALLCGVPVFSTSEAFKELLTPYGLFAEVVPGVAVEEQMALRVEAYAGRPDQEGVRKTLRTVVAEKFSLKNLIPKILATLTS